jgi:PhnB protein
MQLNAYLNFPGTCKEAFTLYQQILGGTITSMMTHGDSPMAAQVGADWGSKIMHARLEVGDAVIMGSDAPPDRFDAPKGFAVSLSTEDVAKADRIFAALAEGGVTQMPIQETFWALRFGMLVDRFGIPWMVNVHKPM